MVPNKKTVDIDEDLLIYGKNTVSEVVNRLQKAERKAKEQGYTDIHVEALLIDDDPCIVLRGTRFETIEELARRRENYLSRRYRDYYDHNTKEKVFSGEQWESELKEMETLGFNMKNLVSK